MPSTMGNQELTVPGTRLHGSDGVGSDELLFTKSFRRFFT
jgi:hypothetical protein